MVNESFQKLNESQIKPVTDTEGAVLVIAGAGSGKTRVLTNRIAYLINEKGVKPSDVLAITFTNKAADEMKVRLGKMINDTEGMWVSTIHSMCVRILRSSISALGYEKNFSIYSEDDKERVLKRILSDMSLEADKYLKLVKNCISSAKNDDLSPREYKDENVRMNNIGIITDVYFRYERELKDNNALDFDDLLIKTLHLFDENDEIRDYYSRRFRYVHIDEFQDTNTVQYKIARILCSYYGNIFVVGDDDQSIYGWRGAKISNILDFEKDFKGARVYKLEQNYRSTKNILNCANLIIKNNISRKQKTLWTENADGDKVELYVGNEESDEAEFVATTIKREIALGKRASDFAVLMRINALSRSLEQEFMKYGVPYKVFGGFKFFDRKEIKDLTAYLRIISNPLDGEAVLRVINVPRRGIGEKTIEAIRLKAQADNLSVFDEIMDCDSLPLNSGALSRVRDFKDVIYKLILKSSELGVEDMLKEIILKTDFLSQYSEPTEENDDKKMNVNELINSAREFEKQNKGATISDYLSLVTLSSDTDEMDESNFVTVATIHSVKGLEFDTVFIVGLDETIFPISRSVGSEEDMEEERRLMYVAITRAKKQLYITRARSRYLYGSRSITGESRFIKEIEPLLKRDSATDYYSYTGDKRRSSESGYGYGNVRGGYNSGGYKSGYTRNEEDEFGYYPDEPSSFGSTKSFKSGYSINATPKINAVNSGASAKLYAVGMKVKHRKFGSGTVIAVKNGGKFIDVAFVGAGIKSLAAEIAPLEIEK